MKEDKTLESYGLNAGTLLRCVFIFIFGASFAVFPLILPDSFSFLTLNSLLHEQCALTWAASSRGPPPTTSSCAPATDPSTIPPVQSCADPPPFHSPWPTATSTRPPERSSSPHGPKPISAREKRVGGTRERFFFISRSTLLNR